MQPCRHQSQISDPWRASAVLKPAPRWAARAFAFSICCMAVHPLASFAQAPAGTGADETELLLQTLDDFHSVEKMSVTKAVIDLDGSYRKNLEKIQKERQAAGNLKGVISVNLALEDLQAGMPPIPGDDSELNKLQQPYLAQRKTALAACWDKLAKVEKNFATSLTDEVGKLTKAGKIEQAMKVQAKLDEFTASLKSGVGGTPKPVVRNGEVDTWKKKAVEEYPALADPKSPLSLKVRDRVKELNGMNPSYFKDPEWPLLLARELSEKKVESTASSAQIPAEAKAFNGKKYHVYSEQCSWHSAREKCEAVGGQLVLIKDGATELFVERLAAGKELWLGATDEAKEGKWVWVDGSDMKFRCFKTGQPDNDHGTNHYLMLVQWGHDPKWNDGDDNGPIAGYICEWPDKS